MKQIIFCFLYVLTCALSSCDTPVQKKKSTPVVVHKPIAYSPKPSKALKQELIDKGFIKSEEKYAFVVFTIEDNFERQLKLHSIQRANEMRKMQGLPLDHNVETLPEPVLSYSVSGIEKLDENTEEQKYKLMDKNQRYIVCNEYKKISNRECLVFDSYTEASKAREKYIIN
jgi:hypothetical protein